MAGESTVIKLAERRPHAAARIEKRLAANNKKKSKPKRRKPRWSATAGPMTREEYIESLSDIRALAMNSDMSREEIAEKAGITLYTFDNFLMGLVCTSGITLANIRRALGRPEPEADIHGKYNKVLTNWMRDHKERIKRRKLSYAARAAKRKR